MLGLAATAVLAAVAVKTSVWLLEYEPPCSQPCKDLGQVPEPAETRERTGELRPTCEPVDLKLEVIANHDLHVGRPTQLFYRLTLTNKTCLELSMFSDGWKYLDKINWSLAVTGPKGKEPQAKEWPGPRYVMLYLTSAADADIFDRTHGLSKDSGGIHLLPGQSVTTLGSVLHPYREVPMAWREPGRTVTGWGRQDVPVPEGVEVPPKGFRPFANYLFPSAGHYQARAVFDEHSVQAVGVIGPYARFVPRFWMRIMEEFGIHLTPTPWDDYHIRGQSNIVDLEVRP